jgi:hydrogenase nickel incorporation protein HypA/HybF
MHEFTLIQNICNAIEKIAAENNLRKITRVNLQVGKMRQVVPEFMQFAFTTIAKGTIYEGAELAIEIIPIKVLCHNCGREFEVEENIYLCPFCSSKDASTSSLEILSGKEFILASIEGE